MAETMLAKEAAKLWNLTERRVTSLCKEGKIKGARKQGHFWHIPVDAERPADHRVKTGVYKKNTRPANLPLPVGVSDYRLASSEYYYVDKTMMLSKMLHDHHGTAPIIIVDEYDTPIQQGHMRGYYDEVILFMRNLFSGGLKDNKHLSFGFLTGILRVAKESIFSGLNNLTINSILDNKYSMYFGFTPDEVKEMAGYYGAADKYDEICEWYDGYRFGKSEMFNPWSVINYFNNECEPRAFWQSTGSNDIIGEIIGEADEEIYKKLTSLVKGETFPVYIDTVSSIRRLKKALPQFTVFFWLQDI